MKYMVLMTLSLLLGFWQMVGAQDNIDCLTCHEDNELTGVNWRGVEVSMFVTEASLDSSVHAGMNCIDCHSDLAGVEDYPHDEDLSLVDCALCHEDISEIYSKHGRVKVGEDEDIPTCADCHGNHNILTHTERASRVSPENLPGTCGSCHEDVNLTTKHDILYGDAIKVFKSSVHGKAIAGGELGAASCNDCHSLDGSAHQIYGPGDTESTINHFNIPQTCGRCHTSVVKEYWAGIHGKLVARGETDSPVCTNCHGEHGIISPSDPRSPVSPRRVAEATCAPCHESAYINEKYGIPTGRLKSWYDSYHGLKSRAGDVTVANCASCHEAHLILPSKDPNSSVHPNNLQKTCGECHPGISPAMARTSIHEAPGISTPMAEVVKDIYIIAIIIIIGLMVVHWLIDLRKQIQLVRLKEQIRRMTLNETWQHTFLMVTFIVLVITGFSLRYSESGWVDLLFGWEGGFPLRGLTTRKGRKFLWDMMPQLNDFKQFFQMIAYNLNRRGVKPEFGRFSYVEKAEYWTLVWGTVVMIITGFFLWFEDWFEDFAVQWFPKGFLDIMLVVHYYEAWLAFLAILVWHMYSTVFSPGVYPMNPSWIDGKMPLDVYKHEHASDPVLSGEPVEEPVQVVEDSEESEQVEPDEKSETENIEDTDEEAPGEDKPLE